MTLLTALEENISLDSVFNPSSLILAPVAVAAYLVILGVYRGRSARRDVTNKNIHTEAS